jgi:hypothetical protein
MGDKANKLRLWQYLCIEVRSLKQHVVYVNPLQLGLVSLDADSDIKHEEGTSDDSRATTPTTSRSITPTPSNPFPESLTQAHKLLKARGHVNLKDYLEARCDPTRKHPDQKYPDYSDLVYPSASAMVRYTIREKRFAKLDKVKTEWLTPLLREMNRGRKAN